MVTTHTSEWCIKGSNMIKYPAQCLVHNQFSVIFSSLSGWTLREQLNCLLISIWPKWYFLCLVSNSLYPVSYPSFWRAHGSLFLICYDLALDAARYWYRNRKWVFQISFYLIAYIHCFILFRNVYQSGYFVLGSFPDLGYHGEWDKVSALMKITFS